MVVIFKFHFNPNKAGLNFPSCISYQVTFGFWNNLIIFCFLLFVNGAAQVCCLFIPYTFNMKLFAKNSATNVESFAMLLVCFDTFLLQATCWPNCVRAISSWYPDKQKATIFGMWGTCTFAGGLIGTVLAVSYLDSGVTHSLKNSNILTVVVIVVIYLNVDKNYVTIYCRCNCNQLTSRI